MRFFKKQKYILALFLVAELFVTTASPAMAGLFGGGGAKLPSVSKVAGELEKRYHLNLESIQDNGESFNTTGNKVPTPEVTLFFSPSDPKSGEKLTARALPVYYSNTKENLYFTWYLKRKGCNIGGSAPAGCDLDGNGSVTVEDWKIAAAQILAQNGFDTTRANYSSNTDNDGYRAKFGGDSRTNTPDRCYVHDNSSGINYELTENDNGIDFSCPSGTSPVCLVGEGDVTSGTNDTLGGNSYFDITDSNTCTVSGYPYCASGGVATCNNGTPRCVADPNALTNDCGTALSSCSSTSERSTNPVCEHLFPDAPGDRTGDGSFGASEERFWGTDPSDSDTADNGNKDEANIAGLGRDTFTWNYAPGDKVGVAVEGVSTIATKHDDASMMIMWAMPKKDCPVRNTGSYTKTIKGYKVVIPTASMDLNDCLERNLVDPTEGGQATNLDVSVNATPDYPINDETPDKGGDVVTATASVANADRNLTKILFDWRVDISDNVQFSRTSGDVATGIQEELRALGLLGNTKGNALDTVQLKLDISTGTILGGRPLTSYLNNGAGYLRFAVEVSESFEGGITRRGRSDVIVKFTSTNRKITAYRVEPTLVGGAMRARLAAAPAGIICNGNALDRNACRVIKNEIIGLRIDPTGLSNFQWTINGDTLSCSTKVSPDCPDDRQNEMNFFPVAGNVGDTYTVSVTANEIATDKVVTLARTFHVVQPEVSIVTLDQEAAWPKFLGQYRDITDASNCSGGLCDDYSTTIFQAFSGSGVRFKADFLPGFLGATAERQWNIDGFDVPENAPGEIAFQATKEAPSVYNVSLNALVVQSPETRRALLDIWNISPLDSPEIHFSSTNQVELQDPEFVKGPSTGTGKFLAAIAGYVPSSLLFAFRMLLSGFLILFTTGFIMALIPEQRTARASSFRRGEDIG